MRNGLTIDQEKYTAAQRKREIQAGRRQAIAAEHTAKRDGAKFREKFDDEIAVGHCIERVFAQAVKRQRLGHHLPVDGI